MSDAEAAFEDHRHFERTDDGFAPTTNDFEATVALRDDAVSVTVTLPTLDAATTEPVADVVEDGWYETFERRVEDAPGVAIADDVAAPDVERGTDEVTVETRVSGDDDTAADDALALVNYVEGTWFQGIIPGYDYVEEVQAMREQAATQAEGDGQGTPL
ncbi:DUF5813 family protein [Halobacterium zhouii]|uniref:DUF5813 family protein n=1 Tax=Halobacterium zhouii TaxID=2902624 RepID=UPI001E52B211|nr:DUF5813 family protein [Halobacterium zhouii]